MIRSAAKEGSLAKAVAARSSPKEWSQKARGIALCGSVSFEAPPVSGTLHNMITNPDRMASAQKGATTADFPLEHRFVLAQIALQSVLLASFQGIKADDCQTAKGGRTRRKVWLIAPIIIKHLK
jgi:hypothetical protein